MLLLAPILLTVPLLIASYFDYRERRIPNFVSFSLILFGLALRGFFGGLHAVIDSLFGMVIGSSLFLILYFFNAMGAGDVKLSAAISIWLGTRFAAIALFYTIMIGGLMAIGQLLFSTRRAPIDGEGKLSDQPIAEKANVRRLRKNKGTLPYGIAISGGTFALFLKLLWETKP